MYATDQAVEKTFRPCVDSFFYYFFMSHDIFQSLILMGLSKPNNEANCWQQLGVEFVENLQQAPMKFVEVDLQTPFLLPSIEGRN